MKEKICSECGFNNDLENLYCISCGHKLDEEKKIQIKVDEGLDTKNDEEKKIQIKVDKGLDIKNDEEKKIQIKVDKELDIENKKKEICETVKNKKVDIKTKIQVKKIKNNEIYEDEDEDSVFSFGLPEWNLNPPFEKVRRKR